MDLHLATIGALQQEGNNIYASFGEGFTLMKITNVTDEQVDVELLEGQPTGKITLHYTQLIIVNS
jgi:hypothetical protein